MPNTSNHEDHPADEPQQDPDALPDGSGTDAREGDAEQDTVSGGAPQQPEE